MHKWILVCESVSSRWRYDLNLIRLNQIIKVFMSLKNESSEEDGRKSISIEDDVKGPQAAGSDEVAGEIQTCERCTERKIVADCELEQIVLVMLHPTHCSDFFSVELSLLALHYSAFSDHMNMEISITEMYIYDLTNHPFTQEPEIVKA